jgi:alpha-glucosidase
MRFSIIGVMQFNLWGIPYVGPDICGFIGDSNAELCQRWMQLGAFYPFSRNHNGLGYIDQDPGFWGPAVAASSKAALEVRYTLLPYLYTLFYHHVTEGSAVFRPLWYNYLNDPVTYDIDRQFMWGKGLLVTPVLSPNAVQVSAYFPDQRHFSYYDGAEVSTRKGTVTLNAPVNFIPVHIVGGNVIPTQQPAKNTMLARQNPLGLIVALDDSRSATGDLFYDDGDSIGTHEGGTYFHATFSMSNGTLNSTVVTDGYPDMASKVLSTIRLMGAGTVTSVTVNGAAHSEFTTKPSGEVEVTGLTLTPNEAFTIVFA